MPASDGYEVQRLGAVGPRRRCGSRHKSMPFLQPHGLPCAQPRLETPAPGAGREDLVFWEGRAPPPVCCVSVGEAETRCFLKALLCSFTTTRLFSCRPPRPAACFLLCSLLFPLVSGLGTFQLRYSAFPEIPDPLPSCGALPLLRTVFSIISFVLSVHVAHPDFHILPGSTKAGGWRA